MKLKSLYLIALVTIVFCGCQSNYQPTTFTVASYNLRNANGSDSLHGNGWGQRYPVIAKMVQYHDFDIFGTQECFLHQLKDMKEALPGYDYIGVGRVTVKTEANTLPSSIVPISSIWIEKAISGCRKLPMYRAKAGMRCCRVSAVGDTSNAKIPVLNSFSSICTWIISARKPVWKVHTSCRRR